MKSPVQYHGCGDAIHRTLIFSVGKAMAAGAKPPLVAKLNKHHWAQLALEKPLFLWRDKDKTTIRLMACQDGLDCPPYVALSVEFDSRLADGHATIETTDGEVVAMVEL